MIIYLQKARYQTMKEEVNMEYCFRLRKYARYGKTSHQREVKTSPTWRKFSSTPENTLILKDSLKIDPFRPKTVKTRYVRAST